MADFPWEDYQTNSTATVEKGPWEDFAAQKPRFKKTRAQVTAEVEKAQAARPTETMSGLEKVAAGAYEPARWASLQPVVQGLENVLAVPINDFMLQAYGPKLPPFVIDTEAGTLYQPPGTVPHYVPGTPLINIPFAHPEQDGIRQISPAARAVSQVAEGLATPGNLALLGPSAVKGAYGLVTGLPTSPASVVEHQVLATLFGPQMAVGAVEETGQALNPKLPVDERQTAAYRAAINAVMAGLSAKGLTDGMRNRPPAVLEPEVLPPLAPRQDYVPAQRQLVAPEPVTIDVAPPTQLPLTTATTLAERNNPQPFSQIIRSQEPIDPATMKLGRERNPIITPQPEDLRAIVKQSVEEVMGRLISNEKRPSQESPVVLGGQQTQAPMVYGPRPVPLDVKVEPGQAFTPKAEIEGGKVSFAAPAEQGAIPSARQVAIPEYPEVRLAPKQDQPAPIEKPVPFVYKGLQPGVPEAGIPDFHLYNMTETVGKLAKGSTVSEKSLKEAGFEIPEGMPKSGIGGGIKKAVEKNKEAGSIANPFEALREKFKKKEEELRGDFALDGPRYLLDPKVSGFNNPTREVDSNQLWNRLKNKLNPAELDVYEKSGVGEEIRKMGKVSPEKAAEMLQEAGPQVKVESYGMEGKVSAEQKEFANLTHEFDSFPADVRHDVNQHLRRPAMNTLNERWYEAYTKQFGEESANKIRRYVELSNKLKFELPTSGPRATSAYETVSPFPVNEPMPEWTKTKSGKNVQRVDVVIPRGKYSDGVEITDQDKWQPDNLHENLPNTLGWAMIQYKTGAKGEKIAVIAEAQSRWGQERRALDKYLKRDRNVKRVENLTKYKPIDHPLLRDYNRLILKAAIEQARKEGATHIMVSDAETAMMTEGHDNLPAQSRNVDSGYTNVYPTREQAKAEYDTKVKARYPNAEIIDYVKEDKGWSIEWSPEPPKTISQEPGMRLNYDSILPKIAEELTGSKGERVSLGEHKNALENPQDLTRPITRVPKYVYRKNLIFKNPDGTPKTDVSGLLYSIDKVPTQKASLFEKDRPETRSTKLYGGAFFFDPDFWRDTFKTGKGGKPERVIGGVQKLPPYSEMLKRAQTPQGFGKLGKRVGGLLDPRAKAVGNETAQALIAWHSQVGMGNSMAALWAESRKRLGDITADKDGTITLANGRKGYMSDVFEAEIEKPGSQPLTPEQKQAVEFWKRVLKDTAAEQKAEGVKGFRENEETVDLASPYFTRPAIGRKDVKSKDQPGKVAVGSERYYQKSREYPTEEMGTKDGIVYEPSFLGRVAHYLKEHYRAIADERLATHLEKLSTNERKFMVDSLTYHPAFRGRYFSNLAKETINKSLDKPSHTFQKLDNALQDFKKYRFSTDAGYLFNQMLPTLFVSPKSWAIAAKESIKAFGSEKALSNYLASRENLQAAQAIVKGGGNIANVWEFIGGSEKKGWVDKIGPIRGSGRAMGVALDVAKIELYKALKPVAEKNGWSETELVEQIGNMVFSASSKSIGVTESRALVERMFFNAPNYLRATANLLAGITELHKNSATSGIARRALIGAGAAIMVQFAVMYKLMVDSGTMDEKEMEDRLNPMKPQFLKLPVRVPMGKEGGLEGSADDKMIDVSYGNILMGIARSLGSLGAIIAGEKEGAVLGQDNPGIKFFSARLSPWLSILKKIETGKDYRGNEQSPARLTAEEMVPLIVTPLLTEGAGSKVGWADAGMTGLGFNTTVESRGARQKRLEGEYAQQVYKAPIDKLNVAQRRKAGAMAEMALAGEEKEGPSLYSLEAPQKRAEKVTSLLSDESQAMLEQAKLKVPNIIATQTEDKKPLKLNKEEQDFYIETYAKELDRRLSNIKRSGSEVNKKRFESITQSVGEYSWTQTKRLINTRAREESKR